MSIWWKECDTKWPVPILWTKVELFCEIFLFAKSQRQYIKITKSLCDHTCLNKKNIKYRCHLHPPLVLGTWRAKINSAYKTLNHIRAGSLLTWQPGNFTSKLLECSQCGATHVPILAVVADHITLPCQNAFIKIRDMHWRTQGGLGGLWPTPQNLRIFSSPNLRSVLWEDEANLHIVLYVTLFDCDMQALPRARKIRLWPLSLWNSERCFWKYMKMT
jgi:hypothetical protein